MAENIPDLVKNASLCIEENLQDVEPIIRAADAAGEREYLVGSGIAVVDGVIYFVHGERVFELPKSGFVSLEESSKFDLLFLIS